MYISLPHTNKKSMATNPLIIVCVCTLDIKEAGIAKQDNRVDLPHQPRPPFFLSFIGACPW